MLEAIFAPHSIAVVGASPDPTKLGHRVPKNTTDNSYQSRIIPIHPTAKQKLDRPAYSSILVVPDPIDLAVIVVWSERPEGEKVGIADATAAGDTYQLIEYRACKYSQEATMATLYVASTETFVGKSAVCIGLLSRAQHDGFKTAYMKPVSVSVKPADNAVLDEDAAFICNHFGQTDPLDRIAPVLVTQSVVEQIMRGQDIDFTKRLREAYVAISRDKDFVVLEGANSWAEGSLVGLSAEQVSDMLEAPVLLISRYGTSLAVDTILAVQRYLGDRLLGVLINQIEEPQLDFVQSKIVPFLEKRDIPVYATLVQDTQLASAIVADLAKYLGGQVIGLPEAMNKPVEHLMIGALGPDAALTHFRRRTNKAVFTGGDRSDLQLVALETSTSVLVLTGNIRPSPAVIDRAEERGVPIILVTDDTLTAVEHAEAVFGQIRFRQSKKIERFTTLFDQNFDFGRLYDELGMVQG